MNEYTAKTNKFPYFQFIAFRCVLSLIKVPLTIFILKIKIFGHGYRCNRVKGGINLQKKSALIYFHLLLTEYLIRIYINKFIIINIYPSIHKYFQYSFISFFPIGSFKNSYFNLNFTLMVHEVKKYGTNMKCNENYYYYYYYFILFLKFQEPEHRHGFLTLL